MLDNLYLVFKRLRQAGLTLRFSKCKFAQTSLKILGHIVSEAGLLPDPEKVTCVKEWAQPTNVRELQSFLGFANYYRRFIQDFAHIANPLTECTKVFNWGSEQSTAFTLLKSKLVSAPILSFPMFGVGRFTLDTDASDFAMGAVKPSRGKKE